MARKIGVYIGIIFAFFAVEVQAQTATISGTVYDSTAALTLPGVNVIIDGLNKGASTNANGEYTINNVPLGVHTVVASFIGFQSKRKTVEINGDETVTIDFQLVPSSVGLDEVVVTALGIKRQERSIGYAVQSVEGEEVAASPETNFVNALAGKTAGVQITGSSGQPGSASRIVIRGASSITGNNQPLFVINGVPISNAEDGIPGQDAVYAGSGSNRAMDIDPNIIEEVTVLKGASATALYGSRASNGVILITTKQGEAGQLNISYSTKIRFDEAIIDGTQDEYLLGSQGFFSNGLPLDKGGYLEPGFPGTNTQHTTSWGPHRDNVSQQVLDDLGVNEITVYNHLENFYETGILTEHSLSFSGGSEQGTYFLSGSRLDQAGALPNTKLERTTLNAQVSRNLFKDMESTTWLNYTNTSNNWQRNGYYSNARVTRIWPINMAMSPYQYEDGTNRTLGTGTDSPYWQINERGFESKVDRFIVSQQFAYDILPWLQISERIGFDKYTDSRRGHSNKRQRLENDGSMFNEKIVRSQLNSDLILNMTEVPITENLGISALIGNNINIRDYSNVVLLGSNQNIPNFFHESNFNSLDGSEYMSQRHLISLFSEVTFDYNDYLYLTLTGRNDWSSTLPKENRSYFYPSASLGVVFSDILGLDQDSPLYYGKIRASVAQVGSDAPVYSLSTYYTSAGFNEWFEDHSVNLEFPYNGVSGFLQSNTLGNPNLKPEMTTAYELGINLRFFQGRVSIDAAYYNRSTRNQIYSTPVSTSTGFTNMLRNAGEVRNSGIELSLNGTIIQKQNFQWDIQANFTKNKNEVVSLAPGVQRLFLAGYAWPSVQAQKEAGYGVIIGYGYERNEKGQLIIEDDPTADNYGYPVETDEQIVIGNIQPDWLGNLRSTFNYKGLSLSGLIDVRRGGDILNFDLNYTIRQGMAEITEQRGTQMTDSDKPGYIEPYVWEGVKESSGEQNDIELLRNQEYWERYGAVSENQVEDGSFIKLRELTLAYQLPQSILESIPIQNLSLSVTGRNLWMDTNFSYGDPEGNIFGTDNGGQGFYQFVTPTTRSITFGLKLDL